MGNDPSSEADWSQVADSDIPVKRVGLPSVWSRKRDRFIPNIPLTWYTKAAVLPGKAPVLAAVLWYFHRRNNSQPFVLTSVGLKEFGLEPIRITRKRGKR
jgi:hypothetical protein